MLKSPTNPKDIQKFFDSTTDAYYAFRCSNCLKVYDYEKVTNFCGACGEDFRKPLPVYERPSKIYGIL